MFRTVLFIILKLICLTLGILLLFPLIDTSVSEVRKPELTDLPDYNYMKDVWELMRESKYRSASELCRDIIRYDMPGTEEAKAVYKLCDTEISSARHRIRRAASGFITGSGNSIEEAGGAIISDLIIYGDIRDLAVQGYYKITGKETDLFIVTLASIGLATELMCWADWMPAVLKAYNKTGALTETFTHTIKDSVNKLIKTKNADVASKKLFTDMSILIRTNSFPRSSYILRYVDTPNDLAVITRITEQSRSLPYLLLKSGGENGLALMHQYGGSEAGLRMLQLCARKGPPGVHWLRNYVPYRPVKWSAHAAKILYMERAYNFIRHAAGDSHGPIRTFFYLTSIVLVLIGVSVIFNFANLKRAFCRTGRTSRTKSC